MGGKICIKCGKSPSLTTKPICRACLNLEVGEQRWQSAFKDGKPTCRDCGVIKTDQNCWRNKSGQYIGRFTTYCKTCSNIRRVAWDKENTPKPGDKEYADYLAIRKEYHKSLRQLPGYEKKAKKYADDRKRRLLSMDVRLRYLFTSSRIRARNKGLKFDLDVDFLKNLLDSTNGACCLTGIPFSLEPPEFGFTINPKSPSLDRIDPKGGYTKDNVRLILSCVNIAFSQFGEEFFAQWATEYFSRLGNIK